MPRPDNRSPDQLRPVKIERNYTRYAEGSCLISVGETKVLCTASVEEKVPPFLKGQGKGWITAEYAMLPRATHTRSNRESPGSKPSGRTMEIQRLVGRSLRSVVNMDALGERTIWLDCDVIQADGGTRTASITGAFVALYDAVSKSRAQGLVKVNPITDWIAAVSVGIVRGEERLDLMYDEDSQAAVDFNVVMTDKGKYVEVQGTAEGVPFDRKSLDTLLDLATGGILSLISEQRKALEAGA